MRYCFLLMGIVSSPFSKWQIQSHLQKWAPPDAPLLNRVFTQAVSCADHNQGVVSRIYGVFALATSFANGAGYLLRLLGRVSLFPIFLKWDATACRQDIMYSTHSLLFTAAMTFVLFASLFLPHLFNLKDCKPSALALKPRPSSPPIKGVQPVRMPLEALQALIRLNTQLTPLAIIPTSPPHNWIPVTTSADPNAVTFIDPDLMSALIRSALLRSALIGYTGQQRSQSSSLLSLEQQGNENSLEELSENQSWEVITPEMIASLKDSKTPLKSLAENLKELFRTYFTRPDDITKDMKYRHVLNGIQTSFEEKFGSVEKLLRKMPREEPLYHALSYLSLGENHANVRDQYRLFVSALRNAVKRDEENQDPHYTSKILFLCYLRWTSISLSSYHKELMRKVNPQLENSTQNLSLTTLWDCLIEANKKLKKPEDPLLAINPLDRAAQKAKGHFNYDFDPTLGPNVPYQAFKCGGVTFLRHGTPTAQTETWQHIFCRALNISPPPGSTEIVSDYKGMLAQLKQDRKKILHCILEKKKTQTIGDESARVAARLALKETFPETFIPIALSVDNPLFNKADPRGNIKSFADLRHALLQEMQDPRSPHYSLPPLPGGGEILKTLFEEVEQLFFEGRQGLSASSKETYQAYILLCYAHLVLYLIKEYHIDFAEAICKDDIDRGNTFKAILYVYILLLSGKENDPAALEEIIYSVLAPPFMVKKQGVIEGRLVFLKYVLDVFKTLSEPQKSKIREATSLNNFFQRGLYIQKPLDQHIYPTVNSAGNLREYLSYLTHFFASDPWAIPCTKNLIQENAKSYLQEGKINQEKLFHQIERDIKGKASYQLGGEKPDSSPTPEKIKKYLIDAGLQEQNALSLMTFLQQGASVDLLQELQAIFTHEKLKIQVCTDPVPDPSLGLGFSVNVKDGVATLQATFLLRVCQEFNDDPQGKTLARLGCLIVIGDHTRPQETTVFRWIVRN